MLDKFVQYAEEQGYIPYRPQLVNCLLRLGISETPAASVDGNL